MRGFVFLFLLAAHVAWSQCPLAEFTVNETVCRGESLAIVNTTAGDVSYSWDMCSGDLQDVPDAVPVFSSSFLFRARTIAMVKSPDGNWFGFAIDEPNNTLVRLSFGLSPGNTPEITDLGSLSGALANAFDMEFWQEDGEWFAIVPNKTAGTLLRLSFGNDLSSSPSVDNLGTLGSILQSPSDIHIVEEDGSIFAFVSNGTSQVARLAFGNSITNTPEAINFDVPGAAGLRGISLTRECDRWFGIVTSYGSNSLHYMDFQNGIESDPETGLLAIPDAPSYSFPSKVEIAAEGGEYFAFVQSAFPANLYRISFGESITDRDGVFSDLGNFSVSSDNYALRLVEDNSRWSAFSIDLSGVATPGAGRLVRLDFPDLCSADSPVQTGPEPAGSYSQAGEYRIAVTVISEEGGVDHAFGELTVSNNVAPDVAVTFVNQCVDRDVNFVLTNTSADIAAYDWDFGDMTPHAGDESPVHRYAATGEFIAAVDVLADNGCHNHAVVPVKIYAQPVADFGLPDGLLCTNNEFTIANNTADLFDGLMTYEWLAGSVPVSNARDLVIALSGTGTQSITLIASIPGCSDTIEKITSYVQDGPVLDFSFEGKCEAEEIAFSTVADEPVTAHSWDFGDGKLAEDVSPSHVFDEEGYYTVTLTAQSANGCDNTVSRDIQVFEKPAVGFEVIPPPQSCSGTPTPFFDTTAEPSDSKIVTWLWDFGDMTPPATSGEQNPVHTFASSGVYDVSLAIATDEGCHSAVVKEVAILQSPSVTITHTPVCLDQPVDLYAAGGAIESYYWETGTSYYLTANPRHTFHTTGDHDVALTVVGDNNCMTVYNETVTVPEPLAPDFSVTRNCVGFEAQFIGLAEGDDPVAAWSWDFGGEASGSGGSPAATFTSEGERMVTLRITGESGCEYTVDKVIEVVPSPIAGFTPSPQRGGAPLEVSFDNHSVAATQFFWHFGDGTTSAEHSPVHTFETVGEYEVMLEVTNPQGCESVATGGVFSESPLPDVAISLVATTFNPDGSRKIIVTIENKGNTVVENLPVEINISGNASLVEVVDNAIQPGAMFNFISAFSVGPHDILNFICVSSALEHDQVIGDNRYCVEFLNAILVLEAYPNPVGGQLRVEWISPDHREVDILLSDAFGRRVSHARIASTEGLNEAILDVEGEQSGIYFLVLKSGSVFETRRILISGEN